jgi:hypothetical protein
VRDYRGEFVNRKMIVAGLIASVAVVIAPGAAAMAATPVAPAVHSVVTKGPPPHDPHCTRDGRWHNNPQDHAGHPDKRCPRW